MNKISVLLVDSEYEVYAPLLQMEALNRAETLLMIDSVAYGYEALDVFKFKRYDVVMIENQLPDMAGIKLMEALKRIKPKACIVFFSMIDRYEEVRSAFMSGAADYLLKSSEARDLLNDLVRLTEWPSSAGRSQLNTLAASISHVILESKDVSPDSVSLFYDLVMADMPFEGNVTHRIAHGLEMVLENLEIDPVEISMSYVARQCAEWISEQEDGKAAFWQMLSWIQKAYDEIMLPMQQHTLIRQAVYYVLQKSDSKKTVSYIAQKLYVNRTYLSEVFKKKVGISLSQYCARVKMYGALVLLLNPRLSKAEILQILGCKDDAHFNASFKAFSGLKPREYKQKRLTGIGKES